MTVKDAEEQKKKIIAAVNAMEEKELCLLLRYIRKADKRTALKNKHKGGDK